MKVMVKKEKFRVTSNKVGGKGTYYCVNVISLEKALEYVREGLSFESIKYMKIKKVE